MYEAKVLPDVTYLSDLVDVKLMSDMIREKLTDAIRFAPLCKVDTTFVGRPGDRICLPTYSYIGDAGYVEEGEAIPMAKLETGSVTVPVCKAGKGIKLTDEAILSAHGDPVGEAAAQLTAAIAARVDTDCIEMLDCIPDRMTLDSSAKVISGDVVADALVKFGEDVDGEKVLFIAPQQLAQLRKDPGYMNASEMATKIMMSGTVGELWGCQLVISNKIKAVKGKFTNFIVRPDALAIYLKRDVMLETARDIEHKITIITADQHYVVYQQDTSKAIKLVVAASEEPYVPEPTAEGA